MTKKHRTPAAQRARDRQLAGDTRPYMMILKEEQEADAKADYWPRGKPTATVPLPDRPLFQEPEFDRPEKSDDA